MIQIIVDFFQNLSFDDITLFFLGLFSIRQLIAENLEVPLPEKWKWLIYNKKSLERPILCRRAYEKDNMITTKTPSSTIIENILELDCRHVKYYADGLGHGRSTLIQSKYFINTLEASYDEEDLGIMTSAIRSLIAHSKLPFSEIDFILYLKSGNQLLARNIFKNVDSEMLYVCRLDGNYSSYPLKSNVEAHMFSVQFENLDALLKAAKGSRSGKLTGIVVDCSISTGNGIKETIVQFNKLIENHNLNINKVEHAFVLYAHKPFNDNAANGYTLHRYFDMDEKTRELIYKASIGEGNIGCIEIYNHLKEQHLLHDNRNWST